VRPALRQDHAETCPDADEILAQAPERDGRYLVVPDQPATDLE
jgi:Asp-tRNA(Asn)/Glu-tRNA(Gln) amidotransferase C subunit